MLFLKHSQFISMLNSVKNQNFSNDLKNRFHFMWTICVSRRLKTWPSTIFLNKKNLNLSIHVKSWYSQIRKFHISIILRFKASLFTNITQFNIFIFFKFSLEIIYIALAKQCKSLWVIVLKLTWHNGMTIERSKLNYECMYSMFFTVDNKFRHY